MRILVAPGSYKSTIRSIEAVDIISTTFQKVLPEALIEKLVLADGGEGTLETFGVHLGSLIENFGINDPLGRRILAKVGFLKESSCTAIVESSQAIGFSLIKSSEMNPFTLSSYGLGELINFAVQKGARRLLVTMGDSVTMDMGIGMLSALGVKFYSNSGKMDFPTLQNLSQIVDFDDSELQHLKERVSFLGLVDTNDFLCGKIGQVQLYGHQKGLKDSEIPHVESAYFHFSGLIKKHFGVDVTKVARCTGSGGVGAALHSFLNAELLNTLDYLADRIPLDEIIRRADITITGEGCIDNQTILGKVPYFVAEKSSHKCIGIVGKYTKAGYNDMLKACKYFTIFPMNPELAMGNPLDALQDTSHSIASILRDLQ